MLVRNRVTGRLHEIPVQYLSGPYEDAAAYDGFGFFPLAALLPTIAQALPAVTGFVQDLFGGGAKQAPPPPQPMPMPVAPQPPPMTSFQPPHTMPETGPEAPFEEQPASMLPDFAPTDPRFGPAMHPVAGNMMFVPRRRPMGRRRRVRSAVPALSGYGYPGYGRWQ